MAFATSDDVEARLGRDLTTAEQPQVTAMLDDATSAIAEAAGKPDGWSAGLSPIPSQLKSLAVTLVVRSMANPQGLTSQQEALGAWSYSNRFDTSLGGLALTEAEERMVRRVIYGGTSASVPIPSIVDDLYHCYGS